VPAIEEAPAIEVAPAIEEAPAAGPPAEPDVPDPATPEALPPEPPCGVPPSLGASSLQPKLSAMLTQSSPGAHRNPPRQPAKGRLDRYGEVVRGDMTIPGFEVGKSPTAGRLIGNISLCA
jgi:hypothetical protein